jgi:TRAP transporter TAXI family solute receptor
MKVFLASMLLLSSLTAAVSKPAPKSAEFVETRTFTFFTGSARGTYYAFAEDIRRACPKHTFLIEPTDGSLDNLGRLATPSPVTNRIGFSQIDALKQEGERDSRVRSLQTVMPMYNETVTLVVNLDSKIKSLAELSGKRVTVGVPASGVWFSANYIKNLLHLNWSPVEMGQEEALLNLLTGDVDAVFFVTGHPSRILNDLPKSVEKRIGILDLSKLNSASHFAASTLPAKTYLWQSSSVELVSVRSILLAASDVSPAAIKALTKCIKESEPELRKWGHPKWSNINLSR